MWQNLWARAAPYVTFQGARTLIVKVCGDMFTNWNGDTDPARLIGYLSVLALTIIFAWLTIMDTYWHHSFNSMAFSAGVGVIAVQLLAAAGGVRIKQSSEVPMPHEMAGLTKPERKKSLLRRVVHGAINAAVKE